MKCPLGISHVVLVVKNPPANARDIRDMGSIPRLVRFPGVGNGNSLQYPCLENPHGQRGLEAPWGVYGVKKSRAWLKWLSMEALNQNMTYTIVNLLKRSQRQKFHPFITLAATTYYIHIFKINNSQSSSRRTWQQNWSHIVHPKITR